MKYKVTRYQPKTITLSEYCEQTGSELEVRQMPTSFWQARVSIPGVTETQGPCQSTIDKAIDSLCGRISTASMVVIPGTDLESAE